MSLCGGPGIAHLEIGKCVEDDLGNDQPRVLFVIGGNDIPGSMMVAGGIQALLISLHILVPVFPLVNIRQAELPILIRLINARQETLALFFVRQMEKDFDRARVVVMEVPLLINNRTTSTSS